jgi:predicted TIM-barrel fold metal-dependent hydrolase
LGADAVVLACAGARGDQVTAVVLARPGRFVTVAAPIPRRGEPIARRYACASSAF